MNKLILPGNTILLFCLATIFTVAACSTTGLQRSEQVQSSMQTVDNDINKIVVQLEETGTSLNQLTRSGQVDMKSAFKNFSDNASDIKKMEKDFAKHAAKMEDSGKAYFKQWDKDNKKYDNPEIQKRSEERRAALAQTYDKIAQNNVGVKEAFKTYVSDVNEIERFLSNDLTSDGLESISITSNKVVNNGSHLKNELQNLQSAIEEAREKMRQN